MKECNPTTGHGLIVIRPILQDNSEVNTTIALTLGLAEEFFVEPSLR